MRIMVLGAGGFIGRHVVAELLGAAHEVVAVARRSGDLAAMFPQASHLKIDLAKALEASDWHEPLRGVDVVINLAGLLRGRAMRAIHVTMPTALLAAARETDGRPRIVLISAISARPEVATDYAQTKLQGEELVRRSGLGWTILRPSLVYGEGSYGGTSLLRGLASLPLVMPLPAGAGLDFTPIHVRDLAHAICKVSEDAEFDGHTLEPAGPDTFELADLLGRYRDWLGFDKAQFVRVPLPIMRLFARIGDLMGNGPISTNSLEQLIAGNAGDGEAFARIIGFRPRALADALRGHPAQVQDRWHARLFFLSPALKAVLVLMWLASAWLGLAYGAERTAEVAHVIGLPAELADPLRVSTSLLDLVVAALVIFDRRARWSTPVQLGVVLGYTTVIGWALPVLWLDPLGPLLKNLPILLVIAVYGAIGDKR